MSRSSTSNRDISFLTSCVPAVTDALSVFLSSCYPFNTKSFAKTQQSVPRSITPVKNQAGELAAEAGLSNTICVPPLPPVTFHRDPFGDTCTTEDIMSSPNTRANALKQPRFPPDSTSEKQPQPLGADPWAMEPKNLLPFGPPFYPANVDPHGSWAPKSYLKSSKFTQSILTHGRWSNTTLDEATNQRERGHQLKERTM